MYFVNILRKDKIYWISNNPIMCVHFKQQMSYLGTFSTFYFVFKSQNKVGMNIFALFDGLENAIHLCLQLSYHGSNRNPCRSSMYVVHTFHLKNIIFKIFTN